MFDFLRSIFKPKPAEPPLGWLVSALRYPELAKAGALASVPYDLGLLDRLAAINRRVNAGIKYRGEKGDTWSVWPQFGDCDDYAMTKRSELIKAGLPIGALRLAVCKTEKGEYHAVLIVVTDRAEYVLDNRRAAILPRKSAGYRWVSMSTADPAKWVAL